MSAVTGLSPRELAGVRGRLESFAAEMFAPLGRKDQRRWGGVYLRGLMLEGRRKSIEPMAERLADGDEQCLQQFVNQSPWDESEVRRRLATRMSTEIEPKAWVIDDTGFPKFGSHSVGVARQYCGALGKVANCQVGVSVNAATDEASCPLDWRLFVPQEWDQDTERRAKAHLPEEVRHEPKWQLALQMLEELADEWGLEARPVLGDGGYGDITAFRSGLSERGLDYVVQVKARTSAYAADVGPERPDYLGNGRPPKPRYRQKPSSLRALVLGAGRKRLRRLSWREGTKGRLRSRFMALRVLPANVELRNAANREGTELEECWLLCEWPPGAAEPSKYWLSNLGPEVPLKRLVELAKLRWRIEHDYRELKDALGLDHFEGRSYRGWNHHVTLVSVAHAFLTLERQCPPLGAAA